MTKKTIFALWAVLAVAACGGAGPAPKETFYRLEVAAPTEHFAVPPLPGVLQVDRVDTEGVLSERAIAYQAAAGAVQRYHYDYWSEAPGLMIQDTLAGTLRNAGAATTVVTPDLRMTPDWILRARLTRFEQVPASGQVAFHLQVSVLSAADSHLILQRDYDTKASTGGDGAAAAAQAMGKAVSEAMARLVVDLGQARPPAHR